MISPDEIPGFVDLQVNGYKGVDFTSVDLTEKECVRCFRELVRGGTAAFMPTLITAPLQVYLHALPIIAKVMQQEEFRNRVLGIHLEGPFISKEPGAIGCHVPSYVQKADQDLLERLVKVSNHCVRMITVAADAEGTPELCRWAVKNGIVVSMGHHLADHETIQALTEAGATAVTHLGNGCPHQIHKFRNPIWMALAEDRLTAMLITDGIHVPPYVIKAMIRAKGVDKAVVTSDMAPAAGLPNGVHECMGIQVLVQGHKITVHEKTNLAGSGADMVYCIAWLRKQNYLTDEDLVKLGFLNPLRLIGLGDGRICRMLNMVGSLKYDKTDGFTAPARKESLQRIES